jgi:hypothetical protein
MCLTDMPDFRQCLAESRVLREICTLILFTWNFCIYAATSYGQTLFLLYFYMHFCFGLSGYIWPYNTTRCTLKHMRTHIRSHIHTYTYNKWHYRILLVQGCSENEQSALRFRLLR